MNANKEIRAILETLFNDSGTLKPEQIVEFAAPKESPLHPYFEWDDNEAAKKYRLDQARSLIRSVTITSEKSPDVHLRAYVSMSDDRLHGAGYRRMTDVLGNEFLRRQLADEMMRQADAWKARADLVGATFNPAQVKRQARSIRQGSVS